MTCENGRVGLGGILEPSEFQFLQISLSDARAGQRLPSESSWLESVFNRHCRLSLERRRRQLRAESSLSTPGGKNQGVDTHRSPFFELDIFPFGVSHLATFLRKYFIPHGISRSRSITLAARFLKNRCEIRISRVIHGGLETDGSHSH